MKKYLLTGLVILLPVTLTLLLVRFLMNLLTQPFIGVVSKFVTSHGLFKEGFLLFSPQETIVLFSQVLILISLVFFTLLLGFLARWFFISYLLSLGDKLLHKIPLINKIYKVFREITHSLLAGDKPIFSQVALVPFPHQGSWTLALLAGNAPKEISDLTPKEDDLLSFFVPMAPNPTGGFVLLFKRKDVVFAPYKVDEALKYIISCGILLPKEPPRAD